MKLLIIDASPHVDGSTSQLCINIIDKLNKIEYELIKLSQQSIGFCQGCQRCAIKGECFQNDDTFHVMNSIVSSNAVLIVSPSYWGDVPAQFKRFIDRCLPYCNTNEHRHPLFDTKKRPEGFAISLRAGSNTNESIKIIKTIEHFLGSYSLMGKVI